MLQVTLGVFRYKKLLPLAASSKLIGTLYTIKADQKKNVDLSTLESEVSLYRKHGGETGIDMILLLGCQIFIGSDGKQSLKKGRNIQKCKCSYIL